MLIDTLYETSHRKCRHYKLFTMKKSLLLLLIGLSYSCGNTSNNNQKAPEVNPLKQQYAGGYIVEVNGISNEESGEIYVLHENGNAKWMWLKVKPGGQTEVQSEKSGSWTATQDNISITIDGNTGPIIEQYKLINNRFVSGDRYLSKSE